MFEPVEKKTDDVVAGVAGVSMLEDSIGDDAGLISFLQKFASLAL